MSDEVWWYATRAAGLMTWATAAASVLVGVILSIRAVKARTGPWVLDLHRFLGGMSVLFLLVHMGTLWANASVDFGPNELIIPGQSTWNTQAAAWGVIAAWSLVLVELTSLLRKWISKTTWRVFHMLSVVTLGAGTYHAFLGGTDVHKPLTWLVAGVGSAIGVAFIAVRLKSSDKPSSPRVARAIDREAILTEMRDRLESLPVPESTAQPELTTEGGALPRRSPVTGDLPERKPAHNNDQPTETASSARAATVLDVFNESVAPPPAVGPLTQPNVEEDLFPRSEDPFHPSPPMARNADDSFAQPDGDSPFTNSTPVAEPFFEPETHDQPNPGDSHPSFTSSNNAGPTPSTNALPDADLFAPATPAEERSARVNSQPFPELSGSVNPFQPAESLTPAISQPAEQLQPEPPPVPDAVDPVTGEPDESAYAAWLVEWLAYAEQYGEETPTEPARADQ